MSEGIRGDFKLGCETVNWISQGSDLLLCPGPAAGPELPGCRTALGGLLGQTRHNSMRLLLF